MIIGIDLGTTFSVIAVNGKVNVIGDYSEPYYIEELDVSIIPDEFGNLIIPSVVAEDPEMPDELIFGTLAKQAIEEGAQAIQFSKRSMGTNIEYTIGNKKYTARNIAREILLHLKKIAENALGNLIEQAVITHPAYFDPVMCDETALAAQEAGFIFDKEEHLLMEPIAAALAYSRTNEKESLKYLTYDIGGGTFDITLVERSNGQTRIVKHGGNRLLGGYNFDSVLAQWIYHRLRNERNIKITIDPETSEGKVKWNKLLRLAEQVKIRLANAQTAKIPVPIKQQEIFDDDNGNPINLTDKITREIFYGLIEEELDETISGDGQEGRTVGCNKVLDDAGWTIDEVDVILLVGGSSQGPWISDIIQKHWQRDPFVFDPDLCVACGAAIKASECATALDADTYSILLQIPKKTPLETPIISGEVIVKEAGVLSENMQVFLTNNQGNKLSADIDENGIFIFDEVELESETINQIAIEVLTEDGKILTSGEYEIEHDYSAIGETDMIFKVLPKPLHILVADGMVPLAEEGKSLPANCNVELKRTNEEDEIEIRLFQENDPIGSIIILDVPEEAPIGARIDLNLQITPGNRIHGNAKVYSGSGTVIKEESINIKIPPMEVPSLSELRKEFNLLEQQRLEKLEVEQDAARRAKLSGTGKKLGQKIENQFASPGFDRQQVWLNLKELKRIIFPHKNDMEPPYQEFKRLVTLLKDKVKERAQDDPVYNAIQESMNRIEKEGEDAFIRKNKRKWAAAYTNLRSIQHQLEDRPEQPQQKIPPTPILKAQIRMEIDHLKKLLGAKEAELKKDSDIGHLRSQNAKQIDDVYDTLNQCHSEINAIDDQADKETVYFRVQQLYISKLNLLPGIIENIGWDVQATN